MGWGGQVTKQVEHYLIKGENDHRCDTWLPVVVSVWYRILCHGFAVADLVPIMLGNPRVHAEPCKNNSIKSRKSIQGL